MERREGAGSGHVRKEGASEGITSTSGSAGSRSRTYPTFYPDIMDVTARAGSGTSALCGIPGGGRPLPPPSRFYTELARATGDGALPPERDMKQLAQVHPVPSRNHNRYQAPSQVLPPIHHRACLPYPTSYLLGTLPLPNLSPRTHEMRTSPRFRLHRRRSHRCLVNVDAQPRTGH